MTRPGPARPVPFTVWGLAVNSLWVPLVIGPGGPDRLDRWAPYALTTIALGVTIGALLDLARTLRGRERTDD